MTTGDLGPGDRWVNRTAAAEERRDYFYADSTHPSDVGHQALADLLIGLVQPAAAAAAAAADGGGSGPPLRGWAWRGAPDGGNDGTMGGSPELEEAALAEAVWALPPPMQSAVVDGPTSLCLMQARPAAAGRVRAGSSARCSCPQPPTHPRRPRPVPLGGLQRRSGRAAWLCLPRRAAQRVQLCGAGAPPGEGGHLPTLRCPPCAASRLRRRSANTHP